MRLLAEVITGIAIGALFFHLGHTWATFKAYMVFNAKRQQVMLRGGDWPHHEAEIDRDELRRTGVAWIMNMLRHPFSPASLESEEQGEDGQ